MKLNTTDINPFTAKMMDENNSPLKRKTQVNQLRPDIDMSNNNRIVESEHHDEYRTLRHFPTQRNLLKNQNNYLPSTQKLGHKSFSSPYYN